MGALHRGHVSLVERALEECDRVVCSIFVNPLQFNDIKDLEKYPRQLDQDQALLREAGCHMAFLPEDQGVFADFVPKTHALGGLDRVLEGPARPGHFQGVANVVERLFHYVRPDAAYFGEKDRQQLLLIRHLSKTLRWPIDIVGCPTVREPDGLAMSSRNQRLGPEERNVATVLYRSLRSAEKVAAKGALADARAAGLAELAKEPSVRVDYFALAHPGTLAPLNEWGALDTAIALVAAHVGSVRLIDNLEVRR